MTVTSPVFVADLAADPATVGITGFAAVTVEKTEPTALTEYDAHQRGEAANLPEVSDAVRDVIGSGK
ncbi:hypothetical protein ABTY61_04490 [Kitasatospora sp. NPDC096128]|uniref:hypothetical protein n=1 Tax=Kitasatospora sp. NPDC096128 TaxID=3155547 RepID=UPI0033260EF3